MRKWVWGVLATLVVAAVVVPAVAAWAAEGGDRDRPQPERAVQREPERQPAPAELQQRIQMLRSQIETLRRSAEAFAQQDMPDLAQQMRARAEQDQRELEGIMRAMQQREGGVRREGQPGGPMPDMMQMARHHEEMMTKLLDGQERLGRQLAELNEKVNALQKDVAALREQRGR